MTAVRELFFYYGSTRTNLLGGCAKLRKATIC